MSFLVQPSAPTFSVFPSFQENTATTIQCTVSSVKPGKGSIGFTIRVGPDYTKESDDSDISEAVVVDSDLGAVSVTYTTQVTLQRKHNGRDAECEIQWRGQTFKSSATQADVRCEY